jgi:uncharacterized protein (TIRG00374 family)
MVAASVGAVYVRAQRWRVLLRPLGEVPLYPAMSATAIGFGASAVLPFRVGEIVRPALLGRRVGVRMTAALSSVVLERLLDTLLVISCAVVLSLIYPMEAEFRNGVRALGAVAGVGLAVLVIMQRRRAVAEGLLDRVLARVPRRLAAAVRPLLASFLDGLAALNDGTTVLVVVAYSVYLWGVIAFTFAFGLLALQVEAPLVPASLTTLVVVAAAVFVPQAPGFLGTWQLGCKLALGYFMVPTDIALAFSFLTWITQMVVNVGTAGVFLAREDISLAQMVRMARQEPPAAGAGAK